MKKVVSILSLAIICFTVVAYAESPSDSRRNGMKNLRMDMQHERGEWRKEKRDGIKSNREDIRSNWDSFHTDHGKLADFLDPDLSDAEKSEVRELWNQKKEDIKAVVKEFIREFTDTEVVDEEIDSVVEELQDIVILCFDNIEEYVDPDLLDDYQEFVDAWVTNFVENAALRLENLLTRKDARQMRAVKRNHQLSPRIKTLLGSRLETLDPDQQEEILNKVLDKIEEKMEAIEISERMTDEVKERLLDMLEEVYELTLAAVDMFLTLEDIDGESE